MKLPHYDFPLDYNSILKRIDAIDPVTYKQTRNKLHGAVTLLSPYITRGVVTLPFILERVLKNYTIKQSFKFIQELAWREYWQSVWRAKGDEIFTDLRFEQPGVTNEEIPKSIVEATTGVESVDAVIKGLYDSGYMHNHSRMGIASIVTNLGHAAWWHPSQWMYYHLLDGDLASNSLSWQWVAGALRKQPYTTSQSLINYSTESDQRNSFLDYDRYDMLSLPVPEKLKETMRDSLTLNLPSSEPLRVDSSLPTHIYHAWHLDPTWHSNVEANRILVLEPSHYEQFPVSKKVIDFIINIGKENIPDLQVYVGEYRDLASEYDLRDVKTRSYPAINHWENITIEPRPSLFPLTNEYHKSFYSFWKAGNKSIEQPYE